MLHYAVVFLVIALIAAVFGFGGIAAGAAGIAKLLFVIFLIGAIVTFLLGQKSRLEGLENKANERARWVLRTLCR